MPLTVLLGQVRFMLSNDVVAVHSEFLKTTRTGDMYRLTRKTPAEPTIYSGYPAYEGEQQTTTKEIVYADREVVIWQDEQQRIALRPAPAPQTETTAIGVAAQTQPAESQPSTTEGSANAYTTHHRRERKDHRVLGGRQTDRRCEW